MSEDKDLLVKTSEGVNQNPVVEHFYEGRTKVSSRRELVRPFKYYTQTIDTEADAKDNWGSLMERLQTDTSLELKALMFPDRTFAWSVEAPSHTQVKRQVGRFSELYYTHVAIQSGDSGTSVLTIEANDLREADDLGKYLQRNLPNPDQVYTSITIKSTPLEKGGQIYHGPLSKF